MAAEAEASREARAKVIAADGEMRASRALKEASSVIDQSPSALQLRYLQASDCMGERASERARAGRRNKDRGSGGGLGGRRGVILQERIAK